MIELPREESLQDTKALLLATNARNGAPTKSRSKAFGQECPTHTGFATPLQLRMKLSELAAALGARLENGAPDTAITGVAGIESAGPGQITFISNPKYAAAARTT